MDRNILEEYQNRIQDILKILEDNHEEIGKNGLEETETRIENRLEELQAELEEVEKPVDMTGISANFIDRRTPMREEYSNDREGNLLREYDTRRLNGYAGKEFAELVEEIQAVRSDAKAARKIEITQEMERLIEKRGDFAKVHEYQASKAQIASELQNAREQIAENIKGKLAQVEAENEKIKSAEENAGVHEEVLTLYKGKGMDYTGPKKALEECMAKKERANIKIARLYRKIENLKQDLGKIDDLLQEISKIDEITKEKEVEMTASKMPEEPEKTQEPQEQKEDLEDQDKRQNSEIGKGEEGSQQPSNQTTTEGKETAQPKASQEPKKEKQSGQRKPEETRQPAGARKPIKQTPAQEAAGWKIESVSFSIEDGSKPVYRVIVTDGKEVQEVISTEVAMLDEDFDKEEIKKLRDDSIPNAEHYYDKGLASALQKADEIYQTTGMKEYIGLLKDKEMILRYPERYENILKISYDFSGLSGKPDEDMKRLQKIAKAVDKKGILTDFRGRPSFLTRWVKSLFTKSLPESLPETTRRMTPQEEMMVRMEAGIEETTEERTMQDWTVMREEEEFDIEEFVKDMPEEAADKFRKLQEEYEEALEEQAESEKKTNPYQGFREKMRRAAEREKEPEIMNPDEIDVIEPEEARRMRSRLRPGSGQDR